MSTSNEIYAARINKPVHISITGLPSANHRPASIRVTSSSLSTTFGRLMCPTITGRNAIQPTVNTSVRHGSLSVFVRGPVSSMSAVGRRPYMSNGGGQSSMPGMAVVCSPLRRTEDLGLDANHDVGVVNHCAALLSAAKRRLAPAPPRLPDYDEAGGRPPPYNPDLLAPVSCRRWSGVVGLRSSLTSMGCPPPPPPSRQSTTTDRCSLSLIAEQGVMPPLDNDDDDDDVFFAEKPTALDGSREMRRP